MFLVLVQFIMVFENWNSSKNSLQQHYIIFMAVLQMYEHLPPWILIYLMSFFKIYQFLDPSLLLNIDITIKLLFFGYIKHYRERVYIFERVNFSLTGNVKGQQNQALKRASTFSECLPKSFLCLQSVFSQIHLVWYVNLQFPTVSQARDLTKCNNRNFNCSFKVY